MTAPDQIISDTIRECIGAIKLGRRVGRTVPTALIAKALETAAEEYDATLAAMPATQAAVKVRGDLLGMES